MTARIAVIEFGLALAVALLGSRYRDGVDEESARAAVASAATVHEAVIERTSSLAISASQVSLQSIAIPCDSVHAFRGVTTAAFPVHYYLVATSGEALHELGGFQAPQVSSLSERLMADPRCKSLSFADRAGLLAMLADPSGAVALIFPNKSALTQRERSVVSAWGSSPRRYDFPDKTDRFADGRVLVTVSLLSWQEEAEPGDWRPLTYAFLFARDSTLVQWSRREWPEFSGPVPEGHSRQ